jgi:hypothetical protein
MSKRIVLCADGTWNTPHGPSERHERTEALRTCRGRCDTGHQIDLVIKPTASLDYSIEASSTLNGVLT